MHSLGCGVSMYLSERCLFLLSDSGRGSPLSRREMIRLYSRGLGWHALSADQLVAVLVCVHRRVCSAVAQAPQHTCKTFMNLRQLWAKKMQVRLSVQSAAGPHLFFKGRRPSCPTCACMSAPGKQHWRLRFDFCGDRPASGTHTYIYMYVNTYVHKKTTPVSRRRAAGRQRGRRFLTRSSLITIHRYSSALTVRAYVHTGIHAYIHTYSCTRVGGHGGRQRWRVGLPHPRRLVSSGPAQ